MKTAAFALENLEFHMQLTSRARAQRIAFSLLSPMAIIVPLVVGASAFAQDGGVESPTVPEAATQAAVKDLRTTIAGGYAHFFDADFDSGTGSVAVDRGFGSLEIAGSPSETYTWDLGLAWEGSWYSFDGANVLSAAAGGSPWGAVQSIVVTPGAGFRIGERWRLNTRFLLQFAGENDADVGDSATYGGIVAASYSFDKNFTLGFGALVTSRIEDDVLVVPQLVIDWRPCKEFRLSNFAGPEAFPGGAGLEAIWLLSEDGATEQYELAFGGRYTYRRFRLADDAPTASGVGTDQGLPLWLRATMRAKCGARVDLVAGIQVIGEMSLDDASGNELAKSDVDPAPFLGAFFSWKF
jgi:hypothetical protein